MPAPQQTHQPKLCHPADHVLEPPLLGGFGGVLFGCEVLVHGLVPRIDEHNPRNRSGAG
jgi:hypothetical protein